MNSPQLPHLLDLWQQTIGWQPTDTQCQQFQHLYDLILAGNQQLNLTRITEPQDFWEKHLWDSIRGIAGQLHDASDASQSVPTLMTNEQRLKVIDIGTGAGFPGIPVAIVHPDWWVTLVDGTRKKIAFVESVISALGLKNARAIADRAEYLAAHPAHRGAYDVVLVRAVAAAELCAHYALPLLRPGGVAILYRGQWQPSDTDTLQPVVQSLGAHLADPDLFTTPLTHSQRSCLYLHKLAKHG